MTRLRERVTFSVPEVFDLGGSYKESVLFLGNIRKAIIEEQRPVFIDFDHVEHISVTTLVALVAEIARCKKYAPDAVIQVNYPKEKHIGIYLQSVGFYKKINAAAPQKKVLRKKAQIQWTRVISGNQANGALVAAMHQELIAPLDVNGDMRDLNREIYRAVTEAMANVVQHAYPKQHCASRRTLKNTWWMLGRLSKDPSLSRIEELDIVFMDQGVGIPNTLRGINGNASLDDGELIKNAIRYGTSSSKNSHRGKGLADMRKLAETYHGALRINSGKGYYEFNGRDDTVLCNDDALDGTLIRWRIPLNQSILTKS